MAMSFEELQEKLDYFNKVFPDMTKSVKEFLRELKGGDSTTFTALINQMEKFQQLLISEGKLLKSKKNLIESLNEQLKEAQKLESKNAGSQTKLIEAINEKLALEEQAYEKILIKTREIKSEMDDLNAASVTAVKTTTDLFAKMKIFDKSGSGISKFFKTLKEGGKGLEDFNIGLSSAKDKMIQMISPSNLMLNVFSQMVQSTGKMVISLSESIKSFEHGTGMVNKYRGAIWDSYRTNLEYSVSLDTTREATQQLVKDMQSFTLTSKENQKSMIETVSLYEKFGASTYDLVEALGAVSDTFGTQAEGSKALLGELRGLQEAIGGQFVQIVDNFHDSFKRLARHGMKQAQVSFKETSVIAKSLKMDFKDLFEITEQFDTYDSAAAAVSRFNAVAGGPYLNAISLMKQTEDERAKSIMEGVRASKINYDLLSAQEKQALASSLGIKDMDTAQKIFTGSLEDYYRLRNITNESEEQAKEKAKAMASVQDKLNSIFESFAVIVEPILATIKWLLGAFLYLITLIRTNVSPGLLIFIGVVGLVSLAVLKLASVGTYAAVGLAEGLGEAVVKAEKPIGLFGKIFGKLTKTISKAVTSVFDIIINFFATAGQGAYAAVGPMLAFALGLAAIGAAVWVVAKAFQAVKDVFSGKAISSEEASIAERLATLPEGTDKKIMGIGDAVEYLTDKIRDIKWKYLLGLILVFDDLNESVSSFDSVTKGASFERLTPLILLLDSVAKTVVALNSTSLSVVASSLSEFSNKIKSLDFSNLDKLVVALNKVSNSMSSLNSSATISITRNISDLFESAGKITNVNTTEIKNVVTEIVRLSNDVDEAKIDSARKMMSELNSSKETSSASKQQIKNVIELNGREMAKWFSSEINNIGFKLG